MSSRGGTMQILRTLNVITLASLLILTGCFGMMDDGITPPAEGEDANASAVNNAPMIAQSDILSGVLEYEMEDDSTANYDSSSDALESFTVHAYYAVIDIDGDSMTLGWDTDLDGIIDIPVTDSSSISTMDIPIAHWNELDAFDGEGYYHIMIAFIAIDEHGLGSTSFYEFAAVDWAEWDEDDDESQSGGLSLYSFSGTDAQGQPSVATDDALIMLSMDQGSDINWASISVKLTIDGAAPVTCDNPGVTGGVCGMIEYGTTGDQVWSVGDGVTISETGQDLCSATCSIDVTVTDTREGKVIDTTNGVPAE